MNQRTRFAVVMLSSLLSVTGCSDGQSSRTSVSANHEKLQGAWRSQISFRSGVLSEMKDLEFLYSYNAGGTMTESSNYDEAANSSPPAYGIWTQVDSLTFRTKYLYYTTKEPDSAKGAPKGDWWPAGHGVLTETITVAADGQTYTSTIKLVVFDKTGAPIAGGGEGTGAAKRIVF